MSDNTNHRAYRSKVGDKRNTYTTDKMTEARLQWIKAIYEDALGLSSVSTTTIIRRSIALLCWWIADLVNEGDDDSRKIEEFWLRLSTQNLNPPFNRLPKDLINEDTGKVISFPDLCNRELSGYEETVKKITTLEGNARKCLMITKKRID